MPSESGQVQLVLQATPLGLIVSPNEEHAVELVRKEEARRDKLSSLPCVLPWQRQDCWRPGGAAGGSCGSQDAAWPEKSGTFFHRQPFTSFWGGSSSPAGDSSPRRTQVDPSEFPRGISQDTSSPGPCAPQLRLFPCSSLGRLCWRTPRPIWAPLPPGTQRLLPELGRGPKHTEV